VLPHGGPAARDNLEFDWIAQALASRGYLVLQPNYRGSDGLSQTFKEAGYGEYGRKMQTDLSDGVRALVKIGVADSKRVCIVGASYGGYAALAGATTEAGVYRCVISIAGVSDLKAQFELSVSTSANKDDRSVRYWLRYTGAANLKDPILTDRSPAMHVDAVAGPILLIHGTNDGVVPFEQSEIMAAALKKANKPYEFVKLKSEDHWLSKADTRLQMLQAVVKFLETNNPP
jgi:dipeptidyl aminopeptidase/acylaminoacyl peptidase